MEKEARHAMKRLLQLLSDDELKRLYLSFGKRRVAEEPSRDFVMGRFLDDVSIEELLGSSLLKAALPRRIDELVNSFESVLERFDKSDLMRICKGLKKGDLATKDMKKTEIIDKMSRNIQLSEILKADVFQKRLTVRKPKHVSPKDVRFLSDKIVSTIEELYTLDKKTDQGLNTVTARLQSIENMFSLDKAPDLYKFLEAFYQEATRIGYRPKPEDLNKIVEKLRERLHVGDWEFILKGMQILLAHYLLTEIKQMEWKPSIDQFLNVFREEFEKAKILENRAEIPDLRNRVCERMGITDGVFDELLIDAWKKGLVSLEPGAPVGEYDTKYLVTEDGRKFYYVKYSR